MEKAMKRVSWILIPFLCFIIQSCNTKSESKTTGNDTTVNDTVTPQPQPNPSPPAPAAAQVNFASLDFPVLYVEFDKIKDLFKEADLGNRRKLVFRFDFDGSALQPTLSGFPAKNNGGYTSNAAPLITLTASTHIKTINTPFYLGNVELSRDEYKQLRDDVNKKKYLVFIPVKSTVATLKDVVTYYTAWSATIPIIMKDLRPYNVGDELNPSPPRDPS